MPSWFERAILGQTELPWPQKAQTDPGGSNREASSAQTQEGLFHRATQSQAQEGRGRRREGRGEGKGKEKKGATAGHLLDRERLLHWGRAVQSPPGFSWTPVWPRGSQI